MKKIDLYSKETKEVYNWCVMKVSEHMDRSKGFSAFDGSTALAVCFDLPKECTIEDILNFRAKLDK
jgi:hypothetical protein